MSKLVGAAYCQDLITKSSGYLKDKQTWINLWNGANCSKIAPDLTQPFADDSAQKDGSDKGSVASVTPSFEWWWVPLGGGILLALYFVVMRLRG